MQILLFIMSIMACMSIAGMQKMAPQHETKTQSAVDVDGDVLIAVEPERREKLMRSLRDPEYLKEYRASVIKKLESLNGGDWAWPARRKVIKEAVDYGVHPDTICYSQLGDNTFPLIEAVLQKDEELVRYLLNNLASAQKLYGGDSLLFYSLSESSQVVKNIFELLLKHGAPVNERNRVGHTVLTYAASMIFLDAHFIVLGEKYGADPFMTDHDGELPLHAVFYSLRGFSKDPQHELPFAIEKAQALIAFGASLDHVMKNSYEGCTLVPSIHVKMRCLKDELMSSERKQKEIDSYRRLLEGIKKSAMARKQLIRDSIGDAISHGPKELVLEYYESEKFAQTEAGINVLYKKIKAKQDAQRKDDRVWSCGFGGPIVGNG